MSKTLKIGTASIGLSLAVYATGMLLLSPLTVFGYLVMLPLAIGGFCLFFDPMTNKINEAQNKVKQQFSKTDAQVA